MADYVDEDENTVTFVPPLFLQRRAWVLDIIRREKVTSILDIGCGEGSLLACLANPASCLAPTTAAATYADDLYEIHTHKIAGIDIVEDELIMAAQCTAPFNEDDIENPWFSRPPRWEPLDVKIWQGGFEIYNENFVYSGRDDEGYECIVSTEVIEHLSPELLPQFIPTVLARYHPRLLLITTPNYTYNARFKIPPSSSDSPASNPESGYLDPTGRTTRIFRHHDHKFEWTTEEFTEWCNNEAPKHGYTVTVSGVGHCLEGGDEGLGFASLCAVFRQNRAKLPAEEHLSQQQPTPTLIAHHSHTPHPSSGLSLSSLTLLDMLKTILTSWNSPEMSMQELWAQKEFCIACGGRPESVLDAITTDGAPDDKWQIIDDGRKWEVQVKWGAFVKQVPAHTEDEDAQLAKLSGLNMWSTHEDENWGADSESIRDSEEAGIDAADRRQSPVIWSSDIGSQSEELSSGWGNNTNGWNSSDTGTEYSWSQRGGASDLEQDHGDLAVLISS